MRVVFLSGLCCYNILFPTTFRKLRVLRNPMTICWFLADWVVLSQIGYLSPLSSNLVTNSIHFCIIIYPWSTIPVSNKNGDICPSSLWAMISLPQVLSNVTRQSLLSWEREIYLQYHLDGTTQYLSQETHWFAVLWQYQYCDGYPFLTCFSEAVGCKIHQWLFGCQARDPGLGNLFIAVNLTCAFDTFDRMSHLFVLIIKVMKLCI
jgi:hypothetical protein